MHFRLHLERGTAFTLDVGETIPMRGVTAVSGPSGSGKTTLLRALAGLDRHPGDEVRVAVRSETWDSPTITLPTEARRIGFVFQEPHLFEHMTVEQNLRYGARRRDVTAIDAIVEALGLAALLPRGTAGLSGGEARRVALGRALAADPAVLFLDEPLSGLDTERKAEVLPYLARAVIEAQVPAIYVTHSSDEITTLADRVLAIEKGRLVGWVDPPIALLADVIGTDGDRATVRLVGASADDNADFAISLRARRGERVRIGIPAESLLVSGTHPGRSSAIVTLPGEVVAGSGDAGPMVSIFGQRHRVAGASAGLPGARVWVSVLRALPRPVAHDSTI